MTAPSARRRGKGNGFALIIVIWGLGLVGLLVLGFAAAARLRAQVAGNISGSAQAQALAEAAVNLVLLELDQGANAPSSQQPRFSPGGQAVYCLMPGGAAAAIAMEDEAGKVDINAAAPPTLSRLIAGLGQEKGQADQIAKAIVGFRSAATNDLSADDRNYAAAGRSYGPKKALFQSIFELDQVLEIKPELYQQLLPYVTVHSRQPVADPRLASAALRDLLGEAPASGEAGATGASGSFLVHAEIHVPRGSIFVQEAITALQAGDGTPVYTILEWRRGQARYSQALDQLVQAGGPATRC